MIDLQQALLDEMALVKRLRKQNDDLVEVLRTAASKCCRAQLGEPCSKYECCAGEVYKVLEQWDDGRGRISERES